MITTEWLTGTIGLSAYFGLKPVSITQAQVAASLQASKYIKNRAKQWASLKKPAKLIKAVIGANDYDFVVTALNNPNQAQPNISKIPHDLQVPFMLKFLEIGYFLHDRQPASKFSNGLVAREVEPPISDKVRFMWSCNTVNDIRVVFDLMDSGALTLAEADAFKELWPELALETGVCYLRQCIEYMYSAEKPTMASWQLQGLSALLGTPLADFQDVVGWQVGYDKAAGPGRPPMQKTPDIGKFQLTDSQKLDAPD